MGIAYILAGVIFFLNPTLRTIDLLPDLFGCLLLIAGMSRLYVLDERIETARKLTFYFAAVSAVKIPLSLYFPFKAKQYLLPFSFVISVIEIILMIGIFTSLIGGLTYLASRNSDMKGHGTRSENAAVVTFIFAIARGVCSFAPELLVLGEQTDSFDYTFRPTPAQNAALIKPYAEVLCFVIILIFGIYTGIVAGKYLLGLIRDKKLTESLRAKYSEYHAENAGKVTRRRMSFAFVVLFASLVLLANPLLDFRNVLPNTLALAVFALGTLLFSRAIGDASFLKIIPCALAIVPLSLYNNYRQYMLLSGTDIDIMGTSMTVRDVPQMLESMDFVPMTAFIAGLENLLIFAVIFYLTRKIGSLEILRDNDTVGIFDILFPLSLAAYLACCTCVWIFPHIRTAGAFMTNDINVYIHYDSISAIAEWASYGTFVLMLYFGYRLFWETVERKE